MRVENIEQHKGAFFKILDQTELSQTGVMTIAAGGDSDAPETHDVDQIVLVIDGTAEVTAAGKTIIMRKGDTMIIPKGAEHHVKNTGEEEFFFFTAYAPPEY